MPDGQNKLKIHQCDQLLILGGVIAIKLFDSKPRWEDRACWYTFFYEKYGYKLRKVYQQKQDTKNTIKPPQCAKKRLPSR